MKTSAAIASILKAEGTDLLFCFPSNPLIDECARIDIRSIVARTERAVLNMADGFSKASNGHQVADCPLVTADRRLYNALQGGPYAGLILWVEDGPLPQTIEMTKVHGQSAMSGGLHEDIPSRNPTAVRSQGGDPTNCAPGPRTQRPGLCRFRARASQPNRFVPRAPHTAGSFTG